MAPTLEHRQLEKKITALSSMLAGLGRGTDLRKLILLIRKPGWTTPAELRFASALVDSMLAQANALAATKASLIQASARVKLGVGR